MAEKSFPHEVAAQSATVAADSSSMTPPYKILFLDIDGVLNTVKGGPQVVFDTSSGPCTACRGDSTADRMQGRMDDLLAWLRGVSPTTTAAFGAAASFSYITYAFCRLAELPLDVVVGRTKGAPHLNHSASNARVYTSRLDEIKAWMKEHPQLVEKYVILDDRDVVPPEDPMYSRFVQPTYTKGITQEEAQRVKDLFDD